MSTRDERKQAQAKNFALQYGVDTSQLTPTQQRKLLEPQVPRSVIPKMDAETKKKRFIEWVNAGYKYTWNLKHAKWEILKQVTMQERIQKAIMKREEEKVKAKIESLINPSKEETTLPIESNDPQTQE